MRLAIAALICLVGPSALAQPSDDDLVEAFHICQARRILPAPATGSAFTSGFENCDAVIDAAQAAAGRKQRAIEKAATGGQEKIRLDAAASKLKKN